ncbi:MAG: hypothetical protein GF320_15475 [Armatimonadia bacterium]|nr:hypothetical protein [Armatimonadia bacterium]
MLLFATTYLMSAWVGQASPPLEVHVSVDPSQPVARVDPRFFGMFTEHIFDALDWRLAAQQIKGRGFENGDADGNGVADPWEATGDVEPSLDTSTSYPRFHGGDSSTSQRLEISGQGGLVQGGLALRAGDPVDVTLHLKAGAGIESLTIACGPAGGQPLATVTLDDIPADWRERSVTLRVDEDVYPAELSLSFQGRGTVWVDQVSMIAWSAVHGWRRDVVELYEWIQPDTLRYPGGNFCQTYHFPVGLGDPDLRPVVPNPAWQNYPEPNNIGTDEFLRLCEHVGMEPILCLNIGDTGGERTLPNNSTERALRESLDWLEYANGSTDTEWGRRRAENGHPEPYGVKLWEVGNEIGYGHIHGRLTAEQYAPRFRRFAEALLETDPSIELIACGHDPGWNRHLMEQAGDLADFVAIHIYDNVPFPGDAAAHAWYVGPWLDSHITALREGGATAETTRLALNEWSYSWQYWQGSDRAVAAAGLLHECLKRADWVAMTNTSDTVARFRNNEAVAFPDPECLAIALLSELALDEVVECTVSSPWVPTSRRGSVPAVDAVATRKGDRAHVSLLNRAFEPATVAVHLPARSATLVDARGILPAEPGARMSFDDPDAIGITDLTAVELERMDGGVVLNVTLDPMSVAGLRLELEGAGGAATATLPPPRPIAELTPLGDDEILPWGQWEPVSIHGAEGSFEVAEGVAEITSPPDSRFGLMSPPIDLADDETLILETRIAGFDGLNALLHLCAEGSEEDLGRMVEAGIESGQAQVWAGEYSYTGAAIEDGTTVRVVIGPSGPGGRVIEAFVGDHSYQRIPAVRWLEAARPRILLYGWGEGLRRFEPLRLRRVELPGELIFGDTFEGDELDGVWEAVPVVGEAGEVEQVEGALTIQGAEDSRFGVLTGPLPQSPTETLVVQAELLEYEATNGLMTLLAGDGTEFRDYAEVGVERGRAQAWMRDWSHTGAEEQGVADLALVVGPPDASGQRRVSAYVNGDLVSYAPHLYGMDRPLRLFLYGWAESRTVWGEVTVRRVDFSPLVGHMLAPSAAAG